MPKLHIPAARVHQGALVSYATALKVSAPVSEFFYSVETLDPADPDDRGRGLGDNATQKPQPSGRRVL